MTTTDLANTPVTTPPAGLVSNVVDPPTTGHRMIVTIVVCVCLVATVVVLRMYTRARIVKFVGWDDWMMVLATLFYFADMLSFWYMEKYGMGKHLWDIRLAVYSPYFLRWWMAGAVLYSATTFFIKFAILLFYGRLFPVESFKVGWWAVTIFTTAYSIAGIFTSIFACTPVASSWDLKVTPDHCIDRGAFYIANAVLNCISDALILWLPIPIVWRLSLNLRKKIMLIAVFALGSASFVFSIMRLQAIAVYLNSGGTDPTYDLLDMCVWSTIEMAVGITCACAPTIRPLIQRYLGVLTLSGSHDPNMNYVKTSGAASRKNAFGQVGGTIFTARSKSEDEFELAGHSSETTVMAKGMQDYDAASTDQIIDPKSRGYDEEVRGIVIQQSYRVDHSAV